MRTFSKLAALTILAFSYVVLSPTPSALAQQAGVDSSNGGPVRCLSTRCEQLGDLLQATIQIRKKGTNQFFRSTIDTNNITGEYVMALPSTGFTPGKYKVMVTNAKGRIVSHHPSFGPLIHKITKKDVMVTPTSFVVDGSSASPQIKLMMPLPVFIASK